MRPETFHPSSGEPLGVIFENRSEKVVVKIGLGLICSDYEIIECGEDEFKIKAADAVDTKEPVLKALRNIANIHPDPAIKKHAGDMIAEYHRAKAEPQLISTHT